MFMIRCEILGHFPYGTRGLPKCPKMAVAEIGHSHEYASRCQNASFQKEKRNGAFWHRHAYSCEWPISATAILGHFPYGMVHIYGMDHIFQKLRKVSPQSTNHENYDAVDNELANQSNPTSPISAMECPAESSIKGPQTQTQKSTPVNLSGSFGLSMGPTQKSPKSAQTQASSHIASQAKSSIEGSQTQQPHRDIVTQVGF